MKYLLSRGRQFLEPGRLISFGEGLDKLVQIAFQDTLEAMGGEADTMVGHPILGKIVGADFFAAFAGSNLRTASCALLFHQALLFYLIQTGAENGQGATN